MSRRRFRVNPQLQLNYHTLPITYQKLITKNAKNVKKEKILYQNVNFLGSKIID